MLPFGDYNFGTFVFFVVSFLALFVGVFTLLTFLERKNNLGSPKITSFKKVSIVIPAYNEAKNIALTIKKINECDYPKDLLEIVVVDDGSTDGTYDVVKKMKLKNIVAIRKPNGGKASAINAGLKYVTGDYVMVLDADTFPQKDVFTKALGNFEDPKVMATTLSIKVYKPESLLQRMQYVEYSIMNFMRKLMSALDAQSVTPAATIFRKKFLDKYGGFDENNLTEDFEMGMRIHSKNYRVAHVFDTFVETVAPMTFKSFERQRVRWSYGGIYNINIYRYMISPKYGDLGILVIPTMLIGLAILPLVTLYYIGMILWNTFQGSYLLYLIGFDLKYQFISFFQDLARTSYDLRYFILATVSLISIATYIFAAKKSNDKISPLYIAYFLLYGIMLMYFNLVAFYRFVLSRKPRW